MDSKDSTQIDATAAERKRRQRSREARRVELIPVEVPVDLRFALLDRGLATQDEVADSESLGRILVAIACAEVGLDVTP